MYFRELHVLFRKILVSLMSTSIVIEYFVNMDPLLLFSIFISVSSARVIKEKMYNAGDRFFLFPGDGDDLLHIVDTTEPIDENTIAEFARQPNNHGYWLYTRSNPFEAEILVYGDSGILLHTHFNLNKTIVFLIHGWLGSGYNEMNQLLTEAFLEADDVNVIVFDWSELANRNYLTAKYGVVNLGKGLGLFIQWLASLGASYNNMHLVGFSLGGHIVGNAGRHTGSLIRRITALDPAGPLWETDRNRLKETDAQYVEVIHTSNLYGYKEPCGHADFYPNGGSHMPGCWINLCSHSKGYEYMAESVKNNHLYANECDSLKEAKKGVCNGSLYPMGNSDINKSGAGIFWVDTE